MDYPHGEAIYPRSNTAQPSNASYPRGEINCSRCDTTYPTSEAHYSFVTQSRDHTHPSRNQNNRRRDQIPQGFYECYQNHRERHVRGNRQDRQ